MAWSGPEVSSTKMSKVRGVYAGQWEVDGTKPGVQYMVSLRAKASPWECSCPRWVYYREECKHIKAVQLRRSFNPDSTPAEFAKQVRRLKKEKIC